ncbi:uncharacterized protein EV420DRAFT_1640380 [Desarmillaria tabescens]|uniref:DUF6533 domain-containing protein n=1 Tax=Armillaria tabescens TaxID=1929756 RepID=A0AA39NAL1_ARMTA|nr:uncharacterized protein EV420DRAFT_1640380 [Desarmillaria tabescens]KAK0462095.1 hypothetical protein EV420DRAFT_1640380 [Desarmillaria tabescens]
MSDAQSYWASFTLQTYNCAYAIMVWDTLLTLSKEKRKIWDREWSAAKVIFFRYYGIASITVNLCFYNIQVPTEECAKSRYPPTDFFMDFTIISYQCILLLRCYAVWLRDKRILFCGIAMLICQFVEAMEVVSPPHHGRSWAMQCVKCYGASELKMMVFTVVQGEKFWVASVFLFPTITDTVLTVITFARVFYITPKTRSSVMSRFVREGFLFFLIVFIGNCANGILYLQPNRAISTIFSGFAIIFGNVCGNHLILAARHDGSADSGGSGSPRRAGSSRGHGTLTRPGVLVHTTVDIELDGLS